MTKRWRRIVAAGLIAAGSGPLAALADSPAERGAYLFAAGGCAGCHTDVRAKGPPLAGGRELPTPFGTFYGPNITSDPTHGLGRWSLADFRRAMREGIRPDGAYFFPVFPYPAFTNVSDADLADLWAYLETVPPVATPSRPHAVDFPFGWRFLQSGWRWLHFTQGPFRPDPLKPAEWNRGAYLVTALGHCAECHSPRDSTGGLDPERWLAGNPDGPEGARVPNLTPAARTGLGKWSLADLIEGLSSGLKPDGDVVGGPMFEVVDKGLSKLKPEDIRAMAVYLKSLPSIENEWRRR